MNDSNRRVFMFQVAAGSTALLAATAQAQPAMVNEKDATAVALGYVADATKADTKKYPKYAAGQKCGTCQLFAGKAGDAGGPCGIFPGKSVAAGGWCSAYVKKA